MRMLRRHMIRNRSMKPIPAHVRCQIVHFCGALDCAFAVVLVRQIHAQHYDAVDVLIPFRKRLPIDRGGCG